MVPDLSPTRPWRILVVDDEPDILESVRDLLEASLDAVEVVTAVDGEGGIKELSKPTDLIISDYKMPGMSGLDFLEKARKMAPRVPRILITAFPDLEVAIRAINDARIETFFTKPLDPERIIDTVSTVLEERRSAQQRDRALSRAFDLARQRGADK